jgi:serine protease Do
LVASTEIGKKVKVGLMREGKPLEVEITIGELPDENQVGQLAPEVEKNFGLVVQNITPEIARHLNMKERKGIIVTDIQPGSPAENADIRAGDIIKEMNRKPVKSVADFKEIIKKANIKEGIVMLIQRESMTFYAVIKE